MHEAESPKSGLIDNAHIVKLKPKVIARVAACTCGAHVEPHFHMEDGRLYAISAIR